MAHNGADAEFVPANPDDPTLNQPPPPPPAPPNVYTPNARNSAKAKAKAYAQIFAATGNKAVALKLTAPGSNINTVYIDDHTYSPLPPWPPCLATSL
jgi:hypothetical protein